MRFVKLAPGFLALSIVGLAAPISAGPITGVELGTAITWDANSTNALNFAMQVPGREGQAAPYVLFDSATPTSVTLNFSNLAPGLAWFEWRIDFVPRGSTAHPVVPGDTIHPSGVSVASGTSSLIRTFDATEIVEVRLALGGERDWDFNWTAFEVEQQVPDAGTTIALLGLGLMGIGAFRRRRS